ncbi:hypothetical protein Sbal223_0375 [Shewanella baltica OS223]|uniref:hypothetical protein n=1 Tax=Shewanella baltica TaxID=62322 RepID=UPI0001883DD2|nr:hypothetical protein [Shewanella baltica]ACK44909.1 hypothetical protein Sbal223_0375 [Shewanella baltica OS223]
MNLLHSMKNATSDSKLLLLRWAASIEFLKKAYNIDPLLAPMEPKQLAQTFGLTERRVKSALTYLVQEGYVDKYPNRYLKRDGVLGPRFEYFLTDATWRGWNELLGECLFKNEFIHALLDKNTTFPQQEFRLLWAALVLLADRFGYVVGYSETELKKMLGMSDKEFKLSIQAIKRTDGVCMLAREVSRTALFTRLPAIFQIRTKSYTGQPVRLGVPLPFDFFRQFDFLNKFSIYQRRSRKHRALRKFAPQNSELTDEQYFNLSKIFTNKKLYAYTHHFCMLIVCSLSQELTTADLCNYKCLEQRVRSELDKGFNQAMFAETTSVSDERSKSNSDLSLLREFTFEIMSREIADKITLLGKQLNRFLSISGGSINLMFFLPKQHMFLTFLESEEQSKIEDEDRSQFEQGDYNLRKKQDLKLTALMLYVTSSKQLKDCTVYGEKILTTVVVK